MAAKSISEIPSLQKLNRQLEGAKALESLVNLLSSVPVISQNIKDAFKQIPELRQQFEVISKIPEKFNQFFAERGWIATESLNFSLMQKVVEMAEMGQMEEAEKEIVQHFHSENIEWQVLGLRSVEPFRKRIGLIRRAFQDYREERYHACIPVILMMIDGATNDVTNRGFFASESDLTSQDSIVGHPSSLMELAKVLSKSRNKTTNEQITLPLRHGILHGHDLGYDNQIVAAKCWATLFAVRDWIAAVIKEKKNPPIVDEAPKSLIETINETIQIYKNYKEWEQGHLETFELLLEWQPRILIRGLDYPVSGISSEYPHNTPEEEMVKFFENWKSKNFGFMASQWHEFLSEKPSVKYRAKKIREIFGDKIFKKYEIQEVKDVAPAVTEIVAKVWYEFNNNVYCFAHNFRVLYSDSNHEPMVRTLKGGKWRIIQNFTSLPMTQEG